ncbi:GNAT family N-acetyltransferase [Sphingomonas sp. TX0543]|uniref:GNAT family N-acetyltransferase n=1 Tax=unclassified Sphingomonas TaxID=196159 RepID=UPI0010F56B72|nr:GNAT family N-acetyltransferase [Sphingomonas sp. 3P27F8]
MPPLARNLIWETFFVHAKRGVDFEAHLPWHAAPSTRSVLLSDARGNLVATAIVRPARQTGVAMVGFVCVDEPFRGGGTGRDLIAAVNAFTDAADYRASLLWTGFPGIYTRSGYDVIGRDAFVRISRRGIGEDFAHTHASSKWPGPCDGEGLPAFAVSAHRLCTERAKLIVAEGPRGVTLLDWQGSPAEVLAIMEAEGHAVWNVNLSAPDHFLEAIPADRYAIECREGAATMARFTEAVFPIDYVPIAERI